MKPLLSLLAAILLCATTLAQQFDNSVVSHFDYKRFLGQWYEVARFDHWFERDMHYVTSSYKELNNGKLEVTNTAIKDNKQTTAIGKIKKTDNPAILRISFFGPFYSDYRILLIDTDYQYALIGSSKESLLWIMSRTPQLSPKDKETILNEAKRRHYDTSKLIWVKQQQKP